MFRSALLLVVALTLGLVISGPALAEESATPAAPVEAQEEPAAVESETELVCSDVDLRKDVPAFSAEIFKPTGLRMCDEQEEQQYCGGCPCVVTILNVYCLC